MNSDKNNSNQYNYPSNKPLNLEMNNNSFNDYNKNYNEKSLNPKRNKFEI